MKPAISRSTFGVLASGETVDAYTLTNAAGSSCTILTYGAALIRLVVPDRAGELGDVVLGFDTLQEFETSDFYFGAVIGRFANRIGHGRFSIDGKGYQVAANNGDNHLHGGLRGFDKVVWKAEPIGDRSLRLTRTSPDSEEGYPGTLAVEVLYTFTAESTLRINYRASTDRPTIVNLTNHAYFNLQGAGSVLGHVARIAAAAFTPSNAALVPTGEIVPVSGSPMDFREAKPIGRDFPGLDNDPRGFDHNFVLGESGAFAFAARVEDPLSGRSLEVWTDQPGLQFYTGNFLRPTAGKGGVEYRQYSGFCLETQHFPDSPNQPNFPSVVLRPGEEFRSTTEYRFPRP